MEQQQPQGSPLINPEQVMPAVTQVPVTATAAGAGVPQVKRKKTAAELGPKEYCWGTGRRKSSVARVRIRPGSGNIMINGRTFEDYFPSAMTQESAKAPLQATQMANKYDVWVNVNGGGLTGQAGAVKLGLARALVVADPENFGSLRDGGYLTRDPRMKERKKYGRRGARRSYQFSKR